MTIYNKYFHYYKHLYGAFMCHTSMHIHYSVKQVSIIISLTVDRDLMLSVVLGTKIAIWWVHDWGNIWLDWKAQHHNFSAKTFMVNHFISVLKYKNAERLLYLLQKRLEHKQSELFQSNYWAEEWRRNWN